MEQSHQIHSTAVIHPGAKLGPGCVVGPYSIVGSSVIMGARNIIGPHCVIEGHTTLGDENRIFQFASVGSMPQDLKYHGEPSELHIGHRNIIREYATLQPGTEGGGMLTKVGDQNLFMVSSHIGHDSQIGSRCVVANGVAMAGHVTVGSGVILGGLAAVHQFVQIGDLAMISGGTMVRQDLPPFCLAQGDRIKLIGLNSIGMKRAGIPRDEIRLIRKIYRTICLGEPSLNLSARLDQATALAGNSTFAKAFIDFIRGSKRGIPRHRGSSGDLDESDD